MWATVSSLAARVTPGSLVGPLLLAGCAAAPEPFVQLSGTSEAVSWEIVDVSQTTVPGKEIRWDYTLIVRTDGSSSATCHTQRGLALWTRERSTGPPSTSAGHTGSPRAIR